ncbi:MAG: signal peptidase II [Candidatus Dadabacteria bacterium]|nr:MAG: signal peptidase II [Candidatus Dadabacteria bacterium]
MSNRTAWVVAASVVVIDRVTKLLVMRAIAEGASVDVVPGFLALTYVRNPGAAFGLFAAASSPVRDVFLVAVGVAAVVGLGWLLVRLPLEQRWQRLAAAAVIGGALGNLYDRLAYGKVVDFVDVYVGRWHWPAFNVADSCITLGVSVLALAALAGDRSKETRAETSN